MEQDNVSCVNGPLDYHYIFVIFTFCLVFHLTITQNQVFVLHSFCKIFLISFARVFFVIQLSLKHSYRHFIVSLQTALVHKTLLLVQKFSHSYALLGYKLLSLDGINVLYKAFSLGYTACSHLSFFLYFLLFSLF